MTTEPQHASAPEDASQPGTPGPAATAPAAEVPASEAAATEAPVTLPQHKLHPTRISGLWIAIGCFAVVLLLLLIFILQNSHTVDISYFGFHGHLPLGVALLLAAVCGVLLVALAGTARILQLRATARRHRRADQQAVNVAAPRAPVS
jgi:uncharacterized integral membrane protein